jgi:hypothetical protein
MNRTKKLVMSLFAAAALSLAATAQAQETPPPSEPPPPPPARSHSSSGDGAGIGVGATFTLSGLGVFGPSGQFVYDTSMFHIEGLFGFFSREVGGAGDRGTDFVFGAGGWYHFHRGASSDFSLGGALTVSTQSNPGGNSTTVTAFEPGAQIRAFITPNVALSARVGLAFQFGDTAGGGTDIQLLGQAQAAFGVTYFFR